MQQDAEEFLMAILNQGAMNLTSKESIQRAFNTNGDSHNGTVVKDGDLNGVGNLIDALFGVDMEETYTCDEVDDAGAEPPVVKHDLHRKLVCNIQGGGKAPSDSNLSATNVTHIMEG